MRKISQISALVLAFSLLSGCFYSPVNQVKKTLEDSGRELSKEMDSFNKKASEKYKGFLDQTPSFNHNFDYYIENIDELRAKLPDKKEKISELTQVDQLDIEVFACLTKIEYTDEKTIRVVLEDNNSYKAKMGFKVVDSGKKVSVITEAVNSWNKENMESGYSGRILTIYIPKTMDYFSEIDILNGASSFEMENLSVGEINAGNNMGLISLKNVSVDKMEYENNMALCEFEFTKLGSLNGVDNMGASKIICPPPTKDSSIENNMGNTTVAFTSEPDDLKIVTDRYIGATTVPAEWLSRENGLVSLNVQSSMGAVEFTRA